MEKKSFELRIKEVSDEGLVEGYLSVFGVVDLQNDKIIKGAFKQSLAEKKKFPLLWQHDFSTPIGIFTGREDDTGLFITAELNMNTVKGREAQALLKQGAISGLSIGYQPVVASYEGDVRILKQVDLWEGSVVTFPANPKAVVTCVKTVIDFQDLPLADLYTEWDSDMAVERVRKWASGGTGDKEDVDWEKYRRAFLWYDRENGDSFSAYKLPIADVIDGRLKAVPRAVFAAAAAIQGARGGVDIPEEDVAKIKSHLGKYYEKMGRTAPWDNMGMDILTAVKTISMAPVWLLLKKVDGRDIIKAYNKLGGVANWCKDENNEAELKLEKEIEALKNLLRGN